MPTKNVNLTPQQAAFIRDSIKRGGFSNASEVVRAGLQLLEREEYVHKLKLKALRRMAKESIAEIERGDFDSVAPADIEAYIESLDARAKASRP